MPNNSLLHPITRWRLAQEPPLSLVEVARRTGVDRTALSKLETGSRDHVSREAEARIALKLGLDQNELSRWEWTAVGRKQAKRVLGEAARSFRARAARRRSA